VRDSRGDEHAPGRDLVETGELVAGSMTRAVAGLLFDPEGSAVRLDERLAACLRDAATSAADLPLTWERARAGAVLAFAAELSVTRSHQGRPVRTDDFFRVSTAARSAAERLVEDVVQAARATTEERRVRHLGYLVAEVVVSPDVDTALAAGSNSSPATARVIDPATSSPVSSRSRPGARSSPRESLTR
jgi:hypothetical protein